MSTLAEAPNIGVDRLGKLASVANHEHGLCFKAAMSMLYHGIAAGEALIEAKSLVGHGGWLRWLAENVNFAETSATSYMQVARHKDFLLGCEDVHTMQTALAKLREEQLTSWSSLTPELARKVHDYAQEHGPNAAAREFGINPSTAQRYAKGLLPQARLERAGKPAPRRPRIGLTDEMIEGLAEWLHSKYGSGDLTDEWRNLAVDALGAAFGVETI